MMTQMQVHLYRDSFTTPWGIRLQGGKDLTSPLVIQRVFPNTPAAGYLHRGDILLSLNGKDASGLTHKQAQDVFQFAGGQIPLIIRRPHIESREAPPSQQQERQTYRTVPLDLEGPTKMAHPHVPKGGMKYGGGGPSYGVSYTPPGGVQRQSSKPWEDNEMLHKVQDTLSHKSYPYQQVSSYNGGPPVHYQPVAPPAYIPGPPESSGDANYIDPFPSYVPQKPSEEEEDDYEFLPVSQRRNQFSKHDFAPETKKPIRSRSRPQTFSAPPPAPRPVVQPVYAPISRPAEGQVIQDETPPWAGTLSNASGAKMWDVGMQPTQHVSPTRSTTTTTSDIQDTDNVAVSQTVLHLGKIPTQHDHRPAVPPKPVRHKVAAAAETSGQDTQMHSVTPSPSARPVTPPAPRPVTPTSLRQVTPPPPHEATPPREATPPQPEQPMSRSARRRLAAQAQREALAAAQVQAQAEAQVEAQVQAQSEAQSETQVEAQTEAQAPAQSIAEPEVQPPTISPPSFTSPPPVMPKPSSFRPAPPPARMRDLTSQPDPLKKEEEEGTPSFMFQIAVFACLCAIIVWMVYMNKGPFASMFRGKVVESQLATEEGSAGVNAGSETAE